MEEPITNTFFIHIILNVGFVQYPTAKHTKHYTHFLWIQRKLNLVKIMFLPDLF